MNGHAPLSGFSGVFRMTALLGIAWAGACGAPDARPVGEDTVLEPSLAPTPSRCLTRDLAKSARDYLSRPEERSAVEALSAMEDACVGEDVPAVWASAWTVLSQIEVAIAMGRAGDPNTGASLADGVMVYVCEADATCVTAPPSVPTGALAGAGIFAVRGQGLSVEAATAPAVASASVPFTDFDGVSNGARWGLETTAADWGEAVGVPTILFYGEPEAGDPLGLSDLAFGDLAFDVESFPDVDGFPANLVHIGVCYETEVTLPHIDGDEGMPTLAERMQREGTILESHTMDCGGWPAAASPSTPADLLGQVAAAFGRVLLPQPLAAALMTDRRAPSTGGSPIDFSRFAPVAADPQGRLEWVVAPQDGDDDEALAAIVVEAVTGLGTPIELVEVSLRLIGNEGVPAGASFCPAGASTCPDPVALTQETLSGFDPVATFNGVRIFKPGGYTICAEGALNGFTFEETCQVVHIKN